MSLFKKKVYSTFLFLFFARIFSPCTEIQLSKSDFVRIENPNFVSPRNLRDKEEEPKVLKNNEIWQQYQKDREKYNKTKNLPKNRIKESDQISSPFYIYKVTKDKNDYLSTFNGLYARFQTSQGTLASINRLESPHSVRVGKELILPIMQGIFIPEFPKSTLEILLKKEFAKYIGEETVIYDIDGEKFYFVPDQSFSGTIIAFFHDTGMQLPLSKKIVTSKFGYRTSPISGKWKFHAGIDLAAPVGTEVFACKSGIVSTTGYNSTYGNYIIILHSNKVTSLYAHLSKILVQKGQEVTTGQTVGLVGVTGATTGPHLHFEVRENGNPKDPGKLISSK